MMELGAQDRRIVRDLAAMFATVTEDVPTVQSIFEPLRRALQLDYAGLIQFDYSLERGWQIRSRLLGDADAPRLQALYRERILGAGSPITAYDPMNPAPRDRNRITSLADVRLSPDARLLWRALNDRFGVVDQLRTIVCDGPSLLATVGGFGRSPTTPRQMAMMRRLLPSVRRRLLLERQVDLPLTTMALVAALETIGSAAMVVSTNGLVKHANARARQLLARAEFRRDVARSISLRSAPGFSITRLTHRGLPPHYLVVCTAGRRAPENLTAMAKARWSLTVRQSQVLELVAAGHSNKTIAAMLRCAPTTIEIHVTAILEKVGVENRAALTAEYWRQQ